ncbi:VCBS repeat-containing protein [Solirubrobacter ginsenosidimutans]|uniref:VCBS repeat-containing protein n=1 Tax=Solirubrobacter ginsenosidimutans TaxID=490573 RepID=A0A9X3N7A9_9ACTN|nr:VCBS repeat-containing protein [Solirubrobacter ginsenosidimutans]MDA0166193.1 VCBS repeat-containing protein [Solirubrobacter ginsenosidimutans]
MGRHGWSTLLVLAAFGGVVSTARAQTPAFVPAGAPIATEWRPAPAVADLNGDDRSDIVFASGTGWQAAIKVLLSKPQGGYDVAGTYSVDGTVNRVALVDLDGDGRRDIVAEETFGFTVLRATATGGFTPTFEREKSGQLGIGDLTGDGRADLAYVNFPADVLNIASGQSDGGFTVTGLATLATPKDLEVADFDGDGRLDALAIHNQFGSSYFAGGASGLAPAVESYGSGDAFGAPLTLDLDGDGDVDRAAIDDYGERVVVTHAGDPDHGYESKLLGGTASTLLAGDFNGDGLTDLATVATTEAGQARLVILPGFEGGRFGDPLVQPLGDRAHAFGFAAGDFDGDGQTDLLIGDSAGDDWGLRVWSNHTPAVTLSAPARTQDKAFDLTRLFGKAAQLRLHLTGPGAERELVVNPRSGITRIDAWADGDYRLRAVALDAGGHELGSAEAVTTVDTASAIELQPPPMPPVAVGVAGAAFPLRVFNNGPRPATIRSVSVGDELQPSDDGCTGKRVAPGETCSVMVRFAPSASGLRAVDVIIDADSLFAPRRLTVTGLGLGSPGPVVLPPNPPVALPLAAPRLLAVRLVAKQHAGRTSTRFTALRLEGLPRLTTVTVACRKGCSRTSLTRRDVAAGTLSLASFTKRALPVGTKLTVRVTAAGQRALTITLTVRARRAPAVRSRLAAR